MEKFKNNAEKEAYWREKCRQWRESKQSQAEFCRENEIKTSTFSSWKKQLEENEAKKKQAKSGLKRKTSKSIKGRSATAAKSTTPTFVRFPVSDYSSEASISSDKIQQSNQNTPVPDVIAELIDAGTGRRLRIFNNAPEPMISALLSAMTAL